MSELRIQQSDIVAEASLNGARVEGKWIGDEYEVQFVRNGEVLAGFQLGEPALMALHVLIGAGLALRGVGHSVSDRIQAAIDNVLD